MSAAVLAVLGGAAATGLLVPDAVAQVMRRREEEEHDSPAQLLLTPTDDRTIYLADHSSHRSHSSHQSHRSSSGGGGDYGGYYVVPTPAPAPPPLPPKPATVSFVAYPGGRIVVDGQPAGRDATGTLTLKAGSHTVRIENRFLGTETRTINLEEGQTGVIEIAW